MRPSQHLPVPMPKDYDPGTEYFYKNFVQHFIPDMIQMMTTGLYVDYDAVEKLRSTIDEVLSDVDARMLRNKVIQKYQDKRANKNQKAHYAKHTANVRDYTYYIKEYEGKVAHRTWVVNNYLTEINCTDDLRDKWSAVDLKNYNIFKQDSFLSHLITKTYAKDSPYIKQGMENLAKYKSELWNRPRYDKANSKATVDPFNPGSSIQKQEIFEMLNVEPLAFSDKTGEASWKRKFVEEILRVTNESETELVDILECIIDHSFSSIIRNNFLKAFDTYTIDEVLHGNIKLFGAKSFRPTSNNPNLLNAPSTGSRYAKPLKRCFIASEGYLVYAIDLSALEDRVIANLSGDTNKQNIFLEGLDGHSLNACGYFPDEIKKHIGENTDNVSYVKEFFQRVEAGDKLLDAIRFRSKAPTFKLAYGGFPDDHKGGVITQEIFDNYHNILYPGISDYRENYVLKTAQEQGYIHLGLGCRLYTDNADNDIRTLHNATAQFWSILTMIAVNELNHQIREAGLVDEIAVCSTIYDSIYLYVKKDAETIKWLNDTAVPVLCMPYLEDQVVPNEASGDLGFNWADMLKVPNNASVDDIEAIITQLEKDV